VTRDLTETYRSGLSLAGDVADPFHVSRVGKRTVDLVRDGAPNELLGHRGGKAEGFVPASWPTSGPWLP